MIKKAAILLILLLFLTSCQLIGTNQNQAPVPPSEIRQWAVAADSSSSYGGSLGQNRDDYSAYAATGGIDVEKCDDSPKAWTPEKTDSGLQWIELTYGQDVFASRVNIRESYNPGSIVKVELDNSGEYTTIWEGKDKTKSCPGTFEVTYKRTAGNITMYMTPFITSKVRITIDTSIPDWHEIDAVELVGYPNVWYNFNNSLVIVNNTE